ncbi:MAG: OPT/YSL family transporter [Planctomycetaceae bacterium]|nr:OPT/YSL family transporter [Planctomycetaceae bacterium]
MSAEHTSSSTPHHEQFENEEQAAKWWLENVYQGDDAVQLTPRAVITGMLIGGVMSISNLYVGLKTGWGLGVTITSCIIAYAVFKFLEVIVPPYRDRPFSTLENYTMSSAASAAGYMSSAGLVSAMPALYLTTQRLMEWWEIMLWLGALSTLGVFMAIPLKRQLINIDQLPFPSGIATAETLKSMHSAGGEAVVKARSLFGAGIIGALVAVWRDLFAEINRLAPFAFPKEFPLVPPLPQWIQERFGESSGVQIYMSVSDRFKTLLDKYTIGCEGSLIMIAAGAIMGIRVGLSMLIGSLICYGIIGPILVENEIAKPGYRGIVSWVLWPSTAMMVTSGLLAFAMKWRTVLRAFSGLTSIFGGTAKRDDPLSHVEVPGSWFVVGTSISGLACIVLGHWIFGITWWMGLVAVLVTFLLSIVAARATGETDITPIGAMGKITQLIYGVLAPTNITTNLMTASITSGAASHAADLLTDLKSGYLLGGNPRKQAISQLFGVMAGTLVSVPAYMFVVQRDPSKLGSADLPAPAAKVWAGVAELLAKGVDSLPAGAKEAIVIGAILGVVLTLLEEFTPKPYRKWIPSSTGLGIAGVIPAFNAISMFIGAFIAWIIAKSWPKTDEKYTVAVSSGLIAGESLMGVGIILTIEILKICGWWTG